MMKAIILFSISVLAVILGVALLTLNRRFFEERLPERLADLLKRNPKAVKTMKVIFSIILIIAGGLGAWAQAAMWLNNESESSFSPDDISGLVLWLEVDSGLSTSGTDVVSWMDQAQGIVYSQDGTFPVPKYGIASQLNGYDVLSWNSQSNQGLIGNSGALGTAPRTIFGLLRPTAKVTEIAYFYCEGDHDEGDGSGVIMGFSVEPGLRVFGGNRMFTGQVPTLDEWVILEFYTDGYSTLDVEGRRFSTAFTESSAVSQTIDNPLFDLSWIGRSSEEWDRHMIGDMAAIIMYDGALSESDRNAVQNYLINKYNLTTY